MAAAAREREHRGMPCRRIVLATGLLVPAAQALASPVPPGPAEVRLEQMLDAVGGRARWRTLRGTLNDSWQFRAAEPTRVRARILMDFESGRFRIDTEGEGGLRLVRVVDGEHHWRRNREGQLLPVNEATLLEDRRWVAAHLYRTLARLAGRDPELSVRLGANDRLEVWQGAQRLIWFRTDARGEPYAFGTYDSDTASTLLGPWRFEVDGVRHPLWTSNADGSFRAQLAVLELNPPMDAALFERPAR